MFDFSVSKDMKKKKRKKKKDKKIREQEGGTPTLKSQVQWNSCFTGREVAVGKATAHFYLILILKELKISVEHGRVVTTLNVIKH